MKKGHHGFGSCPPVNPSYPDHKPKSEHGTLGPGSDIKGPVDGHDTFFNPEIIFGVTTLQHI